MSSGTAHPKHNATWFVRAFRALTVLRAEKHSHLPCCSWLSSKNDAFARILDGTYELWCAPIQNTRSHLQDRCFWFLHYQGTLPSLRLSVSKFLPSLIQPVPIPSTRFFFLFDYRLCHCAHFDTSPPGAFGRNGFHGESA